MIKKFLQDNLCRDKETESSMVEEALLLNGICLWEGSESLIEGLDEAKEPKTNDRIESR
jgi:hypothetical protein